ncbi:MAG TPA: CaiB/BaiF CoA-transferase family protein [Deltaproteobacteria bacterium]|nr:CaiB/BaiF CoA-transferase family protein [Deltaproteobacteria bacterium]
MDALLHGVKVLDFTYLLPGPFATMMLSDLGAEVLRVESPTRIDMARLAPPFVDKECRVSCMHATLNRNKKSLALDLKKPECLEVIRRLISDQGYDIIVEQFRPGAMKRLGLSYDDLVEKHPGLIYCSITGYGQTGPLRDRAGHDINYLSLSGIMSYSGRKDSGPCIMGIQVADVGSGSNNAVIAILAAVIHRMKTGKGQYIDISMTDGLFPHHVVSGIRGLIGEEDPGFETEMLNGATLYGFYETSDGKYISFGGLEPQFLIAFLKALEMEEYIERLMEPDISDEIRCKVREKIISSPRDYWTEVFQDIDACVDPVLSFSEAAGSGHSKARGLIVDVPGPDGISIPQIGLPIRFSQYTPEYRWAGPSLGKDTREIIQMLGFRDDEIRTMESCGVFGNSSDV